MSDQLKLSDPRGRDARLQAVSDATELTDDEKYIRQLEANVAALEKQLAQKIEQASPKAAAAATSGGAKIGARKDASFKAIGTAPSINKTPVGPTMVPIPYPTVQDLSNSVGTARSVTFNGCPVYLLDNSTQPSGKGDERGTGKGVKSGTVTGEIKPVSGSSSVKVEGKQVVREGDACTMNGGNNPGIFVTTQTPGASPPKTAIGTSNPYKKHSAAQLAADIAAIQAPPQNDSGLLARLRPTTIEQAVTAAMQRDALSGNGPVAHPPPTPLQQKQLASLQSSLGMHSLVAGSGNPRSPAQQFADDNGMLYDSAMGGAAYGATRLVGGSDSAGRMLGVIGSGVDLAGGAATGAGFASSRSSPTNDSYKNEISPSSRNSPQRNDGVRIVQKFVVKDEQILKGLRASNAKAIDELSTFQTLGLNKSEITDFLKTREGLQYISELMKFSPTSSNEVILKRAYEQISSGTSVPEEMITNLPLVKIVPKGKNISNFTPFFTTKKELEIGSKTSGGLADYLGLPIKSEASSYDIYEITPLVQSLVFVSKIAPTEELHGVIKRSANGMQSIVPNRNNWSPAKLVDTINNRE